MRTHPTALWAGRAVTLVAALLWFAQGFLPMVGSGLFSESTTLDLVRMDLDGRLGGLLPDGISILLLTTQFAALALVVLAPWTARVAAWTRGVVVLIGVVVAVLQAAVVTGGEWARIGPGAWCALLGAGVAVLGLALCVRELVPVRREAASF